jgi:hypothetical protein
LLKNNKYSRKEHSTGDSFSTAKISPTEILQINLRFSFVKKWLKYKTIEETSQVKL